MASVIGLAPIRDGLKTRLLELLCIHGRNVLLNHEKRSCRSLADINSASPATSGNVKMVPEVGIAPTSQRLQRCANLSQLLGAKFAFHKLVVPRGNAPRSSGYQLGALLLSYGTMKVNREALVGAPLICWLMASR